MKAVIMAGGQGTRLRTVSSELPKPMVPVCGKPILQYQIENLRDNDITDLILVVGYLGEAIRDYFGDGSAFGVRIQYYTETYPLGTAGALYFLRESLSENFLLLMGDLMLSVDFGRFMAAHRAAGGLATLFVHPNAHPYDSDIIVTETVGKPEDYTEAAMARRMAELTGIGAGLGAAPVTAEQAWMETGAAAGSEGAARLVRGVIGKKEPRSHFYHNQVNAGIYALSPALLQTLSAPKTEAALKAELFRAKKTGASEEEQKRIWKSAKLDLDMDVILPQIGAGRVYAYHSTEYVKDMGTPERYAAVSADLENGTVASRNLRQAQKCIFLDRDGTINKAAGFVKLPEQLELLPRAAEAIRRINASPYLAIVVTNQPVLARGEVSFAGLDEIHAKLETELGKAGAYVDDLLFCPHHRDRGFAGEVPALKFDCPCRKPKPGLILEAARRYHIDLSRSWMIGDMTQDIACGRAAGLRTVLLETGEGGRDGKYEVKPDKVAADLLNAVEGILRETDGFSARK